jgi:hypothetical protein
MLSRSDLIEGDPSWVLRVTFGGKDVYFSGNALTITRDASTDPAIVTHGGLDDAPFERAWDLFTTSPSPTSISISIIWPESFAALVEDDHDPAAGTGELSLYTSGTWEKRWKILTGRLEGIEYGGADEPVTFRLTSTAAEDRRQIPAADARVTAASWLTHHSSSGNRYYPLVFGSPGLFTTADGTETKTSGSEALIVEYTAGQVVKLLIADGEVEASTVRIFDEDMAGESRSVTTETDGNGRTVSTVSMSGSALDLTDLEWMVCWDSGGGMYDASRSAALERAGDVVWWLLDQSGLDVDTGRTRAAVAALNSVKIAGYVDDALSPFEVFLDHLAPLLPVSIASGPEGLYPVVWNMDATTEDAVAHIEAGPGVIRQGRVTYSRTAEAVRNEVRFDYAQRARTGEPRRAVTINGQGIDGESDILPSYYADVSQRRYGLQVEDLDTRFIYEDASARRIALWKLRELAFPHRQVTYTVGQERAALEPGAVVTLTDSDLSISNRVCLVQSVTLDLPDVVLTLLMIEDPAR